MLLPKEGITPVIPYKNLAQALEIRTFGRIIPFSLKI